MELLKPYKEVSPIFTVNKIRSILNEVGIFVSEKYNINNDYFTCRIEITNNSLYEFKIGTYGKGVSMEYACASAYAEFMERLQNNALFKNIYYFSKYYENACSFNKHLKADNNKLDFIFCSEERIESINKIIESSFDLLSDWFSLKDKNLLIDFISTTLGINKSICVPFYDQKDNKTVFLPIELFHMGTGSTGMCAGNTPEEAIIQGIGEIFERYATVEVYSKKITPPTIPHEYFITHNIFSQIKKLEEKGLEVIIKDLSLEKNLPVIGVLIIDKINRKYNFKLGSDPWPIIALERCLTELHQSISDIRLISKCDYGDFIENNYKEFNHEDAEYINLVKILNTATGQWPDSLFSNNFSYKFKGLNFEWGKSNKSDLNNFLKLINDLGTRLYIRDVSYLGFNSYYIFAPGLSQDKRHLSNYKLYLNLELLTDKLNNISLLSNDDLNLVSNELEYNYFSFKKGALYLRDFFQNNTDKEAIDLDIDYLLTLLFYKLNKINKAYFYLQEFLFNKDVKDYLYYFACKDYLALLIRNEDIPSILHYLSTIYGSAIAAEVIEDMSNSEHIFKDYNLQWYFDSNNCDIEDFKYYGVAQILKNIEKKHNENPVDQMRLSYVFNSSL